jgi:hypothetical protein
MKLSEIAFGFGILFQLMIVITNSPVQDTVVSVYFIAIAIFIRLLEK